MNMQETTESQLVARHRQPSNATRASACINHCAEQFIHELELHAMLHATNQILAVQCCMPQNMQCSAALHATRQDPAPSAMMAQTSISSRCQPEPFSPVRVPAHSQAIKDTFSPQSIAPPHSRQMLTIGSPSKRHVMLSQRRKTLAF